MSEFFDVFFILFDCKQIKKVRFNPVGNLLLSTSADKTARLWFTETGVCSQVLSGHTDEVISCEFSYPGKYEQMNTHFMRNENS